MAGLGPNTESRIKELVLEAHPNNGFALYKLVPIAEVYPDALYAFPGVVNAALHTYEFLKGRRNPNWSTNAASDLLCALARSPAVRRSMLLDPNIVLWSMKRDMCHLPNMSTTRPIFFRQLCSALPAELAPVLRALDSKTVRELTRRLPSVDTAIKLLTFVGAGSGSVYKFLNHDGDHAIMSRVKKFMI